MMRFGPAAAALVVGTIPALADPAGWPDMPAQAACKAVLTVVKSNCSVEHVFVCANGVQRSEEHFQGEPDIVVTHSRPALTTLAVQDPTAEVYILMSETAPPLGVEAASGDRLPAQSGPALLWVPVFAGPIRGSYESPGSAPFEDRMLDGIRLRVARVDRNLTFNGGLLTFAGWEDVFVAAELGVSFRGSNEINVLGVPDRVQADPMKLIRAGEPGFLADPEATGCSQIGRLTDPKPSPGGTPHDHL